MDFARGQRSVPWLKKPTEHVELSQSTFMLFSLFIDFPCISCMLLLFSVSFAENLRSKSLRKISDYADFDASND